MDEETFNKFIVYDEGSNSEKENETINSPRQPKTTQSQFQLISDFMKGNYLISKVELHHSLDNDRS